MQTVCVGLNEQMLPLLLKTISLSHICKTELKKTGLIKLSQSCYKKSKRAVFNKIVNICTNKQKYTDYMKLVTFTTTSKNFTKPNKYSLFFALHVQICQIFGSKGGRTCSKQANSLYLKFWPKFDKNRLFLLVFVNVG